MLKRNAIIVSIVFVSLLILLLILLLTGNCCFKDHCEIPIKQFKALPIFFNSKDGTFVYPQDDAIMIERDESISIACPGSTLNTGDVWAQMTCVTETTFVLFKDNVDVTDLYCQEQIKSVARYSGKSCESNGREIEVGFDLGSSKFLRQLRICFDETSKTTLYTEHNLTNSVNNRELSGRPYFEEGQFFNLSGKKVYELYSKKLQRININKQLNLSSDSTDIIKDGNSSYYLSRGHLAPKGDFVYAAQQNASFYYVNAAPQWESINGGSWNNLEWKIRTYAAKRDGYLKIITGTFGELTLNGYTGLYLHPYPPPPAITIPNFFWKVVYDSTNLKGVAFVGTNNPYIKKENIKYICTDILKSINWIKLKNQNVTNGIIYACDVNDLRKAINYVPKLQINGILSD